MSQLFNHFEQQPLFQPLNSASSISHPELIAEYTRAKPVAFQASQLPEHCNFRLSLLGLYGKGKPRYPSTKPSNLRLHLMNC